MAAMPDIYIVMFGCWDNIEDEKTKVFTSKDDASHTLKSKII